MSATRSLASLRAALAASQDHLARPMEELDEVAPAVSAWSPGQHLHHIAKSTSLMLSAVDVILAGRDENLRTRGGPSLPGRVVLLTGRIPRGRGQAPPKTRPSDAPHVAVLREAFRGLDQKALRLGARADEIRAARQRLEHPALGTFNVRQWLRFAGIHARHHLAIVDDILRTRPPAEAYVGATA